MRYDVILNAFRVVSQLHCYEIRMYCCHKLTDDVEPGTLRAINVVVLPIV